jgi:hypothetical protein
MIYGNTLSALDNIALAFMEMIADYEDRMLAGNQYSDFLRNLGAHAIAVDEINRKGEKTLAVVPFSEKEPDDVPSILEIKSSNKTLEIPLVARVMEKFRAE